MTRAFAALVGACLVALLVGSTSAAKLPSTGAWANSNRPTVKSPKPTTSGTLIPNRITTLAESPSENPPITSVAGR